jgi:alpha-1,2-glucosyltransferase
MILAAISLIIAGVCNLGRVLRQIWPYLAVLMAFISFVAWNGSVVLGRYWVFEVGAVTNSL